MSSIAASVQSKRHNGYIEIEEYLHNKRTLVGADDELREELVGQGVKVSSVKLGLRSSLEIGFMLSHMILHFGHGITDSDVIVEKLAMPSCIPFSEGRQLL